MKPTWFLFSGLLLLGCEASRKSTAAGDTFRRVDEPPARSFTINPVPAGIPVYQQSNIEYRRGGKKALSIQFVEPVVVSVASKPEKWGYHQFPNIEGKPDGSIGVRWKMNADAIQAYGQHEFGGAISRDGGKTWQPSDESHPFAAYPLENGDRIQINTPKPIPVAELTLPQPIGRGGDTYSRKPYSFYKLHDLPESRQGVYIDRLAKGSKEWKTEKAALHDPQAARYTLDSLFPVVWWGDIRTAADRSLIAGIYPGFIIRENGDVDPHSGVFFYRSADGGKSWNIQGRIPYVADLQVDTAGGRRMGYTEPAFEILADGIYLCVIRTTDGIGNGPMYISRSSDKGVTWSRPEVMAPSGVLPQLLQLGNGVTVLASGRPGVQLRFSQDGKGREWTEPFEMLPFQGYSDQVSCGYTGLLPTGRDRFLIVYSDFKYPNEAKELRKAIKIREVVVQRP